MTEIYGHRWTSAQGDEPNPTWVAALSAIAGPAIAAGLRRCIEARLEWPPTLPEFLAMCEPQPSDFGLSSVESAYQEACRLAVDRRYGHEINPSHPAVWHAAVETGLWNLCEMPADKSRPLFERNWKITVAMVIRGEVLRAIPKPLPAPADVPVDPAVNAAARDAALAKLDAMFAGRSA